jgi:hypothetical protein
MSTLATFYELKRPVAGAMDQLTKTARAI